MRQALQTKGLEETANTIAWLVKNRKKQRGGKDKFRHAISEWEYDLNRLKNEYYDASNWAFSWPSYEPSGSRYSRPNMRWGF